MPTGAELVVAALEAAGVQVAFGLPGVHNLAVWQAFAASPIRLVGVRHEQAAGYAADGYARATGRVGVAITTSGPGAANAVCAVGEAWASRSPVVLIATDIATSLRRAGVYRGALHETTDQAAMFAPVTKATITVASVDQIGTAVRRAVATAAAAPARPVYLQIPTDLLVATHEGPAEAAPTPAPPPAPTDAELDAAAKLLQGATRPLVWAGGGAVASGAGPAVEDLAERLAAPVVTTFQARGLVAGHPYSLDLPPHLPGIGALWDAADVVVAVGSDLDGMMTQNWAMPAPPHLVVVNVDGVDGAKSYPPEIILAGDAAAVISGLSHRLAPRPVDPALAATVAEVRAAARSELTVANPAAIEFLDVMAAALPSDATIVADMCIPGYWLGGFAAVAGPRRLAYPVGWGTLGFAFPAALGAALGGVGPVVSVSGDGGFLFACGELATMAQEQIPLTAVIVDDGGYGMLRYDQQAAGQPPLGVDLQTPDFAALARSFGVAANEVGGLGAEFGDLLAAHIAGNRPGVIVARAALEPPPTTSPRWPRATRKARPS